MTEEQKKKFLHRNMAVVGGFFAGYSVLLRMDFLGNAQTANLIFLVFALLGQDIPSFLLRLFGFFIYVFSIICFVFVKNKTKWNLQMTAIIIDALTLVLLSFLPEDFNFVVSLYPIFFSMPFHWNAFPGGDGFVSSTIFSSNNTNQMSLGLGEYLCDGDRKHLKKAWFFFGTLLCFYIGVAVAYVTVNRFSVRASRLALLLLIPAAIVSAKTPANIVDNS